MKSPFHFSNLKGSIALLIIGVGTAVFALIPGTLQKTAGPIALSAAGSPTSFASVLQNRAAKSIFFGVDDASVTTDKSDYHPGEIVHITGFGFGPGEDVQLLVEYKTTGLTVQFRPELSGYASGHQPWVVTADGGGNFTADWLVEEDSLNETLSLTASGLSSGLFAQTTFTDSSIGTYDQCSNDLGDGFPSTDPDPGCHWINGNLNANNSTYHEGDSTVQRAWLTGFTAGTSHTITFQYGTTKGGKHAYDYLTTWSFSENWISLADRCQDITGCTTASEHLFTIPNDPNVDDSVEDTITADRQMTIRGGTITAISTPTIVSGTYATDSDTAITVTFTTDSTGSMCGAQGCDVALFFGAHVSRSDLWTALNGTTGATTIPGSPYHVRLAAIDGGSIGNRDNQMQANAIVPPTGTLTITKLTIGGFGTFGFTASPTPSPLPGSFNLTTSSTTNPQSTSFANVPTGVYRITESSLPAGWTLNSLVCTGDTNNNNVYNLAAHYVDIGLDNAEGQNCTFTNILPDARIVLSPLSATNAVGSAHTITATVTQNDQLTAGATGGDGTTGFGPAPDGTVVTFSLLNNTAGASFVSGNTCTTSGGTGTCTVQINSTSAGGVDIHATTTFNVLGVSLTRASGDGISGDGIDVHKTYVNAKISLSPLTATNAVNSAHTITATVQQDDGIPAGSPGDAVTGFGPAPNGTLVTFSITSGSATFVGGTNTCTTTGGTCSVQINSTGAGTNTIHATTTFSVGGVSLTRATGDTNAGDGANVTKVYVDAKIGLSPLTATNNVGQAHTITATVQQDDGIAAPGGDNVNGFGPAPNGVVVTFTLTNSLGATATFVSGINTCTTAGGTGTCTVQINSPTAGHVVIHATTTFSVGGVSLTRATGDSNAGDSADAQKDYVAGSLTLVKRIVNDNGGTAVVGDFGITTTAGSLTFGAGVADGANTLKYTSNTLTNLAPATYTLHEGTLTGYSEGTWACVGAAGTVVGNPQTGSVAVAANENVTCTITNNDVGPSLTIVKRIINDNGGTAVVGDFGITTTAGALTFGAGTADGANTLKYTSNTLTGLSAGTAYTLHEGTLFGYTEGTWSCDFGTVSSNPQTGSVTLSLGQSATCTITNNDVAPTLQLNKHVINNNGGTANASAWTLTATGSGGFTGNGAPATGTDASLGPNNVTAGIQYVLSESGGPSGYSTTGIWSCTGSGTFVSPNKITLSVGQTASCTITNDDIAPTLQLNKHVINNNGGTANASAWTLTATGSGGFTGNGAPATGVDASLGPNNVTAGIQYALSESGGPSGYSTNGVWVCTGGGTFVSPNLITLGVGQSASCTITNDDIAPTLQLNKHVINDNGGTANASAWTLTATGSGGFTGNGAPATGVDASLGPNNVTAGIQYALSESGGPSGYSTTGIWSCTGGGTFVSPNLITLGVGQTASCTITNDDNAPSLKLVKRIVNDNGGTAVVGDFGITTTAGALTFGAGVADGASTLKYSSNTITGLSAGVAYSLHEGTLSGYSEGTWSCDVGTVNSSNPQTGSVTLALGQSATCTITNNDNAPSLTIVKRIVNDNGGTAVVGDFGITTTAGALTFGAGVADGANTLKYTSNTLTNLIAGTASLHEGTLGGYAEGTWSCVGNAGAVNSNPQTGSVVLGLGENVTCTITNNDIPGTIIIRKITDPLNNPQSFDFDASGPLPSGTDYQDFSLTGVSTGTPPPNENVQQLNKGTYTVTEINIPSDWLLTGVGSPGSTACVRTVSGAGDSTGFGVLSTKTATINLDIGDTIVCTFENTHTLVTRTQGFWATHSSLTNLAWFGGTTDNGFVFLGVANTPGIGDINLCGRPLDTLGKVLGGFWSNVAKTTCVESKRTSLDKARMTLLQQLLAAELNASAFGSVPIGGIGKFQEWEDAFCGTDITAINTAKTEAAFFNESGDSGVFTPGTSANPKQARELANYCFWDNLPAGYAATNPFLTPLFKKDIAQ